jgi:flagella basal body P-ring formation protein FlgA
MVRSLTILACLLAWSGGLSGAVKVNLRAAAVVRGLTVVLGEVADIDGEAEAVAGLKGLELSRSPRAGISLTLSRSRIKASLVGKKLDQGVVLAGAESVQVTTELVKLTRAEINRVAVSYVRGRVEGISQESEIVPRGAEEDIELPAGKISLKVVPVNMDRLAGMLLVPIQVAVDGELYKVIPVTVQVKLHQAVVVALSSLRQGSKITQRDIGLERRDITRADGKYFSELEQVLGKLVKGYIRAGAVIVPSSVEIAALIKRRQNITIIYRKGNVVLTLSGQALADGRLGEIIPVQNSASSKKLQGRVLDKETVEVVK